MPIKRRKTGKKRIKNLVKKFTQKLRKLRRARGGPRTDIYRKPGNVRYKQTECINFDRDGSCPYGVRCQFAHGIDDVRPLKGRLSIFHNITRETPNNELMKLRNPKYNPFLTPFPLEARGKRKKTRNKRR